MKTTNLFSMSWIMALAMIIMVSFTACSDDDDQNGNSGNFTFPEMQEVTKNVGETFEISFKATTTWRLSSSERWCRFVSGDFLETNISGTSGDQTITVDISADGQNYSEDAIADITLIMGTEEQIVYKITRPKKVFSGLAITDENGNAYDTENPIVIKGSGIEDNEVVYTIIKATSEFEVGVVDIPSWISVTASAEEAGRFSMTFNNNNNDNLNPIYSFGTEKEYSITFSVKTDEGLINVAIPVIYEGLKEDAMAMNPSYMRTLMVSADGQTFTEEQNTGGTGSTEPVVYQSPLKTTLTVRNDKYHILMFSQTTETFDGVAYKFYDLSVTPDWITVTENNTELTITADAIGTDVTEQRGAVVMAFSEPVWEKIKDNLEEALIENVDMGVDKNVTYIKEQYQQNIVADFLQEPEKAEDTSISFKAFYTEEKIADWSVVTESDLKEIVSEDDGMIMNMADQGMSSELGIANYWGAMFNKNLLSDGKSICILVDGTVPANHMIGAGNNPYDGIISAETKTINGKTYIVLSGDTSSIGFDAIMMVVGDFEMMEFSAQLDIMFF